MRPLIAKTQFKATMSLLVFLPLLLSLSATARSTSFEITNNCSYTIWPAAIPGGGVELLPGQNWTITTTPGNDTTGRIWARTNCTFDATGNGTCLSGGCGDTLNCTEYGSPPATLVEYALLQYGNNDFYDISLVDGFNLPIAFTPTGPGNCSAVRCSANVTERCPAELRSDGGCNSACTVFKSNQYCCRSGTCRATKYSTFFKELCPNAYSYPQDDPTSTFTCSSGGNYTVTFCP